MFVVTEEDATAIRTAYEQEGELSAAIALRRLFPGVTDNAEAHCHAPGPSLLRQPHLPAEDLSIRV